MNGSALNHSRGVGLIEVLITMLLLSTALLTLASLQTRSLQYNQSSYFRSQANILAYDMLDKIRANKRKLSEYNYTLASFAGAVAATSPREKADMYDWRKDVNTKLPSSETEVTCVAASRVCTVRIKWKELNSSEHTFNNAKGTTDDATTFTYMTRITEPQ